MKHFASRTALAASLTLGFAAAPFAIAQPAAVDEDVAATPTALAELLGPGGIDAAQYDFYLSMQMPGQGSGVMHWHSAIEDDHLVFSMTQAMNDGEMTSVQSHVFTAEGAFVRSSNRTESSDFKSAETTEREGDKVTVVSSYTFGGDAGEPEEAVHDYQRVEDTIPTAWLPLAFAYHLRAGHEQFIVRMTDSVTGEMPFVQVFLAENIGTEMITIGDEEHEAHVLMLAMSNEVDGEVVDAGVEQDQTMQMYVLADGSIARMHMEMEGMEMSAQRVTAEEAEAMFVGGDGAGGDDE